MSHQGPSVLRHLSPVISVLETTPDLLVCEALKPIFRGVRASSKTVGSSTQTSVIGTLHLDFGNLNIHRQMVKKKKKNIISIEMPPSFSRVHSKVVRYKLACRNVETLARIAPRVSFTTCCSQYKILNSRVKKKLYIRLYLCGNQHTRCCCEVRWCVDMCQHRSEVFFSLSDTETLPHLFEEPRVKVPDCVFCSVACVVVRTKMLLVTLKNSRTH